MGPHHSDMERPPTGPRERRDYLSITDVAERTTLSQRRVEQLVASGELFSVRLGRRRLIPSVAYDAWRAGLELAPDDH